MGTLQATRMSLTTERDTDLWNDSCAPGELAEAVASGADMTPPSPVRDVDAGPAGRPPAARAGQGGRQHRVRPPAPGQQFDASDFEVTESLSRPVDPRIVDALYRRFPDFQRDYDEQGLRRGSSCATAGRSTR